jgi:CubicO group peptidase (beta-lactamase class C family)
MYNTGAQVLGVLIERATGTDLPTVMRERVLEPLGMASTGFHVPPEQIDRLTTFYAPDPQTGAMALVDGTTDSWWSTPPRFPDASAWLVSTIDDLWAFVSMVLASGTVDGTRVLSEQSVALMTTNRLTASQRAGGGVFLAPHAGWGLGMEAPASDAAGAPLPCGFGWDGGSGTSWRTHAESGVTGILLTQRALTSPEPPAVNHDFWTAVNGAIA